MDDRLYKEALSVFACTISGPPMDHPYHLQPLGNLCFVAPKDSLWYQMAVEPNQEQLCALLPYCNHLRAKYAFHFDYTGGSSYSNLVRARVHVDGLTNPG